MILPYLINLSSTREQNSTVHRHWWLPGSIRPPDFPPLLHTGLHHVAHCTFSCSEMTSNTHHTFFSDCSFSLDLGTQSSSSSSSSSWRIAWGCTLSTEWKTTSQISTVPAGDNCLDAHRYLPSSRGLASLMTFTPPLSYSLSHPWWFLHVTVTWKYFSCPVPHILLSPPTPVLLPWI